MRALVYRGPGELVSEDVAYPRPAPGEVVVAVEAAGVCGTDHHLVSGGLGVAAGTIPGHETAGRIVELGTGVDGWHVGDSVVAYGQVVCGSCPACVSGHENRCASSEGYGMARHGGFAELVAVASSSLVALPAGVTPAIGAIATDAIATPFHALCAVGRVKAGETVVVVGAGGLGLHAVALARMLGAGRVVAADPSVEARALALEFGADDAVDPAAHERPGRALRELAGGADAAFEFVGTADTVEMAVESLAPGGRAVVVGVGHDRPRLPPIIRFVGMELSVAGSFGSTRADIAEVLALIATGRLDASRSVSRLVGLEDGPLVFSRPPAPGRTVLQPRVVTTRETGEPLA